MALSLGSNFYSQMDYEIILTATLCFSFTFWDSKMFEKIEDMTNQGPLLLEGLLGAEMMSLLKIKNFLKSSLGLM